MPFTYYNETYDHVYVNECGSLIFGDDNIYDDCYPSEPPIPNPTMTDPNNAIHAQWGSIFWNPHYDPDQAVYTKHLTAGGRNWFVVEWHHWDNLLGGPDTFETILDLDSNEVVVQYMTVTHTSFATAGIEDPFGTEGVLYVWDDDPWQNHLHNRLAVKYGVGQMPEVNEVFVLPWWDETQVKPGTVVSYHLTISNTSSVSDTFALEIQGAEWPTSYWDPSFTTPLSNTGLMESCTTLDVGVKVEVPSQTWAYHYDRPLLGARSQRNTLILGSAPVTTTVIAVPGVAWLPDEALRQATGLPSAGQEAWYTLAVTNTGNVIDVFGLSVADANWDTSFWDAGRSTMITETSALSPYGGQVVQARVQVPPWTYAGSMDTASLWARAKIFTQTVDVATVTTAVAIHAAVDWIPEVATRDDDSGRTVPYVVEVRNRGNVDDRYSLLVLGAEWDTTIWNASFTEQIYQTDLMEPGGVQRVGVRVHIPSSATPPDLDGVLLRAISTYTPDLWADALLVTRVTRPAPGDYGVKVTPVGQLDSDPPGGFADYAFVVSNEGTRTDSYILDFQEGTWPLETVVFAGDLPPGASGVVSAHVSLPPDAIPGDWDRITLTAISQNDPSKTDAATAITVARDGELVRYRLYLPLVVNGHS
jgi:hypothetical protein